MTSNMDDGMLEPNDAYQKRYKEEFKKNTIDLFDELTKKSNVNIEENKLTCSKIEKDNVEINKSEKSKDKLITIRKILIIMCFILTFVCFLLGVYYWENKIYIPIILIIFTVAWIIFTIVIHFKFFKGRLSILSNLLNKFKDEKESLIKQAYEQMAALNALFDWNIPCHLIEKTVPIIEMDQYFDAKKADYLANKYGFNTNDPDSSTVFIQSGSILGNPFLLCKDYCTEIYNKTWVGSITIHWTTTYRTKDGTRTVHHTQTLTANVVAPAPRYFYDSYLVYGNDAAPNLTFSRGPSGMTGKSDKEVNRFVKKRSKELEKKAEKAVMNGEHYTQFGNEEFEALFGGTNRDNEIEYRLLFTPLAQKNMINLIRHGQPYGDDFTIYKKNYLNFIRTNHGENFNYSCNPSMFINYNWEECKKFFIDYNCKYFESFYFELAPLMCVPLYQQHKSKEYIYNEKIDANFSNFEYEQMANSFDPNALKHEESITGNIFKTERINTIGDSDRVKVTAYSYRGERRVTYFHKMGGDGHMHTIPVYWVEYFPVEQENEMLVSKAEASSYQFNVKANSNSFKESLNNIIKGKKNCRFMHCVFGSLLLSDATDESIASFNSVLKEGTSSVQTLEEMLRSIDSQLDGIEEYLQSTDDNINPEEVEGEVTEVSEDDVDSVDDEDYNKNIDYDDDEFDEVALYDEDDEEFDDF
ncbi:MAG: hypothetical protein K6E20_01025 [Acholeplasmatales bacterium]|nr:hypothetical protein [Acholeplasmatales bacterium]